MSEYSIYVWDAEQYLPTDLTQLNNPDVTTVKTADIPKHDTDSEKYQKFVKTLDDFFDDATTIYPDIYYGGHYVLDNHVSIEQPPEEIREVFELLIAETAVHLGMCVYYNQEIETLYLPQHKADFAIGNAVKRWEGIKKRETESEQSSEDNEVLPAIDDKKEMKKFIKKLCTRQF